jgi:multiple sugar transport system permease protein
MAIVEAIKRESRPRRVRGSRLGRLAIYVVLIAWTLICLFPIYWAFSTSFKLAPAIMQGKLIPFVDYEPAWRGWDSLGLSPRMLGEPSSTREEFLLRFRNSAFCAIFSTSLAVLMGSCVAYGLSRFNYRFGFMRNSDISFFFLSQLIMPPVVLALPFLVVYNNLHLLDTLTGLVILYTLSVLPIAVWIMYDQFNAIPTELDEAAYIDGLSIWGAFLQIVLPLAVPGMIASFMLGLLLTWNEYFFAAMLTSSDAKTLPIMLASQIGSQNINWWTMAAIASTIIAPLVIAGILLEKYIVGGLSSGAIK